MKPAIVVTSNGVDIKLCTAPMVATTLSLDCVCRRSSLVFWATVQNSSAEWGPKVTVAGMMESEHCSLAPVQARVLTGETVDRASSLPSKSHRTARSG
jgi:hypothetical protein